MTAPRIKRDPWIKFYPGDWRAEPRLKMCSRAARSLWLDMLGLMHEASPYGFLLVEGIAPTPAQLAYLVGDPERVVKQWLAELAQAGVYSVVGQPMPDDVQALVPDDVPAGTLLSRRLVRDGDRRERDRANGRGGGNPHLRANGLTVGLTPTPTHEPEKRAGGVKPERRNGLRPRSQKPETRKPPDPPAERVIPPPLPCWEPLRDRALAMFRQEFCDFWLFPALIVVVSDSEVALEAGAGLALTRLAEESQRLHELFEGKTVRYRVKGQA